MAYIEREALKAELKKKIESSHNARCAVIEEDFIAIIDDMPAADVVEVKHGHWEKLKDGYWCSNCCILEKDLKQEYNYCPNCGAKMDGKDGE